MADEDDDRWFWNDDLYLEYLRSLPEIDPSRRGTIRYVDPIDLSDIRAEGQ